MSDFDDGYNAGLDLAKRILESAYGRVADLSKYDRIRKSEAAHDVTRIAKQEIENAKVNRKEIISTNERIRLLEQKNQALEEANKQLLEFRNGKVGPEIL